MGDVRVTTKLKKNMQVEAEARGHKIMIDEPTDEGGDDSGMTPVELVLAGLGSCLSITAKVFAKPYDVNLNGVVVELEGYLDPNGFKGKEGVDPGFEDISFTMHIDSDSPKKNIERLIEVVKERCPVSDTLTRNIEVNYNYTTE